jgi:beta-phosphoglucomutase
VKMPFKGVLWDMDGVIVDTGQFHFQAWLQIMPEYGIPFDWEVFRSTFGMNNVGLLAKITGGSLSPDLVTEISDRKEALFRQIIHHQIELLPGVKDWLQLLHQSGVSQAVASSAPQANIDFLLDELEICDYFSIVLSAEKMPGKPDPAVFLEAAYRTGRLPGDCLVIEDSIAGVTAAKRAGCACLAVTTSNPAEALNQADWIIDRLDNLTEVFFHQLFNPDIVT